MDVFEKEWHQLTIEIYLDSAWSMIHLKTWDIFSTKHPKFFFFNLFEVFDFHFEIPLWFLLISALILEFPFWIPRWFVDFHTNFSQTEQKAQATNNKQNKQTNSKQSRCMNVDFLFDFHFDFSSSPLYSTFICWFPHEFFSNRNKQNRKSSTNKKGKKNSKAAKAEQTKKGKNRTASKAAKAEQKIL
jgi:hypothetical protein